MTRMPVHGVVLFSKDGNFSLVLDETCGHDKLGSMDGTVFYPFLRCRNAVLVPLKGTR